MNPIALWPLGDRRQRRRRRRQEATPTRRRREALLGAERRREIQVIDRSDTDEMSGFSTPHVDERHFSTLNADGGPSSRRLTSTRSDADPTRELEEHNKYFSALYARVFVALAADEKIAADGRLAADKKSKGFLARGPTLRRKSPFDRGRTSRQRGHFCLFFAISCCCEVYRDLNYSAPPCVGAGNSAWQLDVDERHFSTLNADKKSKGILARGPTSGRKTPFDRGRTSQQQGRLRTTRRLNCRCNCLFFAISCCSEVYRDLNYSAADERLAADEKSKFSTHDVDRSDTDEMSRRRRQEATPTRSPSSRPLTSTRS
jgi:hypothetical protein